MQLHELVYVSLANHDLSLAELQELLDQSRSKNARLGITGMLIYHDRSFMQLLEGGREPIFELYATICRDERNQQNHLLWEAPITTRSVAQWSMAFIPPDKVTLPHQPGFSDFLQTGHCGKIASATDNKGRRFLLSLREEIRRNSPVSTGS